ncbi:MAG: hypothetical protein HGB03_04255 [Candidatus Yonathbacteria bacterium]|nr:hypothetical protein [Candidatus Yonathbacteria bacterium]NTW47559.1 hypothetical protein [Candidatus Yonathbacteria bacterium]
MKFIFSYAKRNIGYVSMFVVVFGGVFLTIMSGMVGFISLQKKATESKEAGESAIQIAEAGLDYYRWHLAHYPNDMQDGTGVSGPYTHEYYDPEGGLMGSYTLDISGNVACGTLTSVEVRSTGRTVTYPHIERTTYGKYARPSVAEYAYIVNDNVWAGDDRVILGRYHANGGIRMDGTNQSLVTSGVSTWSCTASFGCNPTRTKAGIFGDGSGSALWEYPAETVDFTGLALNLGNLKTSVQNGGGLYFSVQSTQWNTLGYHLLFNANGTVTVYRVTRTDDIQSYTTEEGWEYLDETIDRQSLVGTYTIPSGCSVIYVEDNVWIEGTVRGKVTLIAANTVISNIDANVYLIDDILYTTPDGSDGLTIVGENDVLIPYDVPYNMDLHGVFIAQKGRFGRNHYDHGSRDIRGILTMHGSTVSFKRVGTKWMSGNTHISGFVERYDSYDRKLATDAPPFTPYVDDEYRFVEWREMDK